MKYRKLRIAWSIVWGLGAMLLVVFWIRSNFWLEEIYVPIGRSSFLLGISVSNHVGVGFSSSSPSGTWFWAPPFDINEWLALIANDEAHKDRMHTLGLDNGTLVMAYWLPVILSSVIAACPWFPGRFSLRTLLIATTLVAVVLGLTSHFSG
jgi:hypothetical protein